MTLMVVLTVLGGAGGLALLLVMAATPLLAALPGPGAARGAPVRIPAQRGAADPVHSPLHAA